MYYPQYETFSQCLTRILDSRQITAAQLSRMLNHKSKTTLFRIFRDQAGADSIARVCDEVLKCRELKLTADEKEQLRISLRVSQYGMDNFRTHSAMWELLKQAPLTPIDACLAAPISANDTSMSEFFASLTDARQVDVVVLNCCWHSVMSHLTHFLDETPSENVRVHHYMAFQSDTARTINIIHHILPLISYVNYMGYSLFQPSNRCGFDDTMNSNIVVVRAEFADGVREYQLLMHNEESGAIYASANIYSHWQTYLAKYKKSYNPIKSVYPSVTSAADYIAFTDNYRIMETNHNIYSYKPDIGLNYINADILRAAIVDGVTEYGIDFPDLELFLDDLVAIQRKRFNNIFLQKRVSHCVVSAEAMRNFAQTGVQTDHFFAMRPYTVAERLEILSHCVNQLESNPYFNVYLLKDEHDYITIEATCFEGIGVQFTAADTDYDLSNGHTEAIVTQKEFTELFIRFFIDELVKKHTQPLKNTVALFNSLIAELAAKCGE